MCTKQGSSRGGRNFQITVPTATRARSPQPCAAPRARGLPAPLQRAHGHAKRHVVCEPVLRGEKQPWKRQLSRNPARRLAFCSQLETPPLARGQEQPSPSREAWDDRDGSATSEAGTRWAAQRLVSASTAGGGGMEKAASRKIPAPRGSWSGSEPAPPGSTWLLSLRDGCQPRQRVPPAPLPTFLEGDSGDETNALARVPAHARDAQRQERGYAEAQRVAKVYKWQGLSGALTVLSFAYRTRKPSAEQTEARTSNAAFLNFCISASAPGALGPGCMGTPALPPVTGRQQLLFSPTQALTRPRAELPPTPWCRRQRPSTR